MSTIFAVSSGAPPAAIAVLRISGPDALVAARRMMRRLPEPRVAGLRALRDGDGALLDRALVLIFPGPDSATGEDLVELHLHGGRAVVRAVERVLGEMPSLRQAEPGEFTRRALSNGRIDLTEAEGLGDLLVAETEHQRRTALRNADGGLRRQIEAWTDRLLGISARLEAELDFSDEDDVPTASVADIGRDVGALADDLTIMLEAPTIDRVRDGVRVVLAGPRNAGKSSLFNAMAGREAAIVSPIAGTTRDLVEAPVARNGVAYVLIDTAGLVDETADPIEAIGVSRARESIVAADVMLWLGDEPSPNDRAILLHPRSDEPGRETAADDRIAVSSRTGEGLTGLWEAIERRAYDLLPAPDAVALNRRQREMLGDASQALSTCIDQSDALVLAEHLRWARLAFDRLTGRADSEAMLDAIFSRFCIGK